MGVNQPSMVEWLPDPRMWSNKAIALENIHLHEKKSSISTHPYANGLQANVTLNGRLCVLINEAKWQELKEYIAQLNYDKESAYAGNSLLYWMQWLGLGGRGLQKFPNWTGRLDTWVDPAECEWRTEYASNLWCSSLSVVKVGGLTLICGPL